MVDLERERDAGLELARFDNAQMNEHVAGGFLRVGDTEAHTVAAHLMPVSPTCPPDSA